jgi:hypothetical protein
LGIFGKIQLGRNFSLFSVSILKIFTTHFPNLKGSFLKKKRRKIRNQFYFPIWAKKVYTPLLLSPVEALFNFYLLF